MKNCTTSIPEHALSGKRKLLDIVYSRLLKKYCRVASLFLLLGFISTTKSYAALNVAISTPSTVSAGAACTGTTNVIIYRFTLTGSGGGFTSGNFTALTFTQAGTAATGTDVTQYKLWSGSVSGLPLATSTSASFSGFSVAYSSFGTTNNYYITADIASGATAGNTIIVSPLTTTNVTLSSGTKSTTGSIATGGTQTIAAGVSISGPSTVCVGSTVTLNGTPSGGTWASSSTAKATVGSSTGIVGGVSGTGTSPTITYTSTGGCTASQTETVSSSVTPSVFIFASPTGAICAGTTVTFNPFPSNGGSAPTYQWSVNSSVVGTGATYSSSTFSNGDLVNCTMTSNASCLTTATATSATTTMTVNPLVTPAIPTLSTPASTCSAITLNWLTAGANNYEVTIATGSSMTGIVSGPSLVGNVTTFTKSFLSANTIYYYQIRSENTCGGYSGYTAISSVTTNPTPAISGSSAVCIGSDITLTGTPSGGAWASVTPGVATIDPSAGIVGGVSPGTSTIHYAAGGCTANFTETASSAAPPAFTITPSSAGICPGGLQALSAPNVSGGSTTTTFNSTGAFTVPDNSTAGITNAITVSGIPSDATIVDVSVELNSVTMASDRDLTFNIEAPDDSILNLVNREGSFGSANFTNTIISSASFASFTSAPFTGTFGADESNFVGPTGFQSNVTTWPSLFTTPNGTWTLAVRDQTSGNIATVNNWSVIIHYTTPAGTYTWSPTTGLYNDAGLTSPYTTGVTTNTVYASPAATATYTGTLLETGIACAANSSSTITVNGIPALTGVPGSQSVCFNPFSAQTAAFAYTGITGAANQYTLTWSPGGILADVSSFTALPGSPAGTINVNVPSATSPGTYTGTLTLQNASGCTSTSTVTIVVNPSPAVSGFTASQNLCFNASSAQTAAYPYTSVINGADQYTITWSPSGILPDVTSLTALPGTAGAINVTVPSGAPVNTYSGALTIENSTTGCSSTSPVTANINGIPGLTGLTTGQNLCYDASSSHTASFGYSGVTTGAGQYTLTWSPGGPAAVTTYTVIPAGSFDVNVPAATPAGAYTGTLTIQNVSTGCTSASTIAANVNGTPALTGLTATQVVCFNASFAQTALFAYTGVSNGANQYTLTWSPGSVLADVSSFAALPGASGAIGVNVPAGTAPGSYTGTLTVKNSSTGCTNIYTITTTINGLPALTGLSSNQNLCFDAAADQTAPFAYTGTTNGADQYLLTWSPGAVLADVISFTALPAGAININVPAGAPANSYTGTLVVKNSVTGCSSTSAITTNVNGLPALTGLTTSQNLCFNASADQTASFSFSGTINADQYTLTWLPGSILADVASFTAIPAGAINVNVPAGTLANTYTGTLTLKNSATGCTSTSVINITVNPLPALTGLTASQVFCFNASAGQTASFAYTGVTNSANQYTLTWSPAGILADADVFTALTSGSINVDVPAGTPVNTYTGTLTTGNSLTGCSTASAVSITVNPLPDAGTITGTPAVCPAAITTLNDVAASGAWSSTATGIATVTTTGDVTGVVAGTTTISYTVTNSCGTAAATQTVTVNPLPVTAPVTGTMPVCAGVTLTTPLNDITTGGAWSSHDPSTASVDATGIVTGVAGGIATISYTVTNDCGSTSATTTVTVLAPPASISGNPNVCIGSTTALGDITTGGTWASNNISAATVDEGTGVVTGVTAAAISTISYTSLLGCIATIDVTVSPVPDVISGTALCSGSVTTLSDIPVGGTWASSDGTAITTPGGPGIGIISGVSAGSPTITYTLGSGCFTTTTITVNPVAPVSGITNVCFGTLITLTDLSSGGGIWNSSDETIATVDPSGNVTGVAPGAAVINYTLPTGCLTATPVVFQAVPSAITGATDVCTGAAATLSNTTTGGTWSSSDVTLATVAASGLTTAVITGVATGTPTISYTVGTGCTTTTTINVNALPAAPSPVSGTTTVCALSAAILTDPTPDGTWSSSNTSVASASASGTVIGLSAGTTMISYTLSNGCGSVAATSVLTVNALPATPAPVTGAATICNGSDAVFSDLLPGAAWGTSDATIATVSPAGLVTALTVGTATISYTNVNSCGSSSAIKAVTVNPLPDAGSVSGGIISSASVLCAGSVSTLTDVATGGVWTSGNVAAATVSVTGDVTGVATGLASISYTVTNGCGSVSATAAVSVNSLPATPASISGVTNVCQSSSALLHDATPVGIWSSSNTTVATVSTAGMVTGVNAGAATISYSKINGCGSASVGKSFTVNPLPVADSITGVPNVCVGSVSLLNDSPAGGIWLSDDNSVAVVSPLGIVTGIASGTVTISYVALNSCGSSSAATLTVNVNQLPDAGTITGSNQVCMGNTVPLSNVVTGGAWSSSDNSIATISGAGVVTGVNAGTATITYSFTNSCGTVTTTSPISVLSLNICNEKANSVTNAETGLNAYPNPSNGTFSVLLSSNIDEPMHIIVTNAVGQKVSELTGTTNTPAEVKLNKAAGLYLVSVTTDHGNYVTKVTVE